MEQVQGNFGVSRHWWGSFRITSFRTPVMSRKLFSYVLDFLRDHVMLTEEAYLDRRFSRTELLIGREGLARLAVARVALFGLGGWVPCR